MLLMARAPPQALREELEVHPRPSGWLGGGIRSPYAISLVPQLSCFWCFIQFSLVQSFINLYDTSDIYTAHSFYLLFFQVNLF